MNSILVVQISDLHIKNEKSPAILRLSQMASAIGTLRDASAHVLVLITGDVAYSGLAKEYEVAIDALSSLEHNLKQEWGFEYVRIYVCPGNHDCDFTRLSDGVRDALLAGLNSEGRSQLEIIDTLSASQTDFFNFSGAISHPLLCINSVVSLTNIEVGGRHINLEIINTAWSSKLTERPGALRMPAEALPQISISEDLSIALLHHPLNWYTPQDGKVLSDWLDMYADIALWGHEHRSDEFAIRRRRFGSSVFHMLAMPVDDATVQCGFRAIVIHSNDSMDVYPFEWKGSKFQKLECYSENLPSNPARSLGQVRFSREFKQFLQDPGAKFSHRRLDRQITISDIAIEPAFKSFTGGGDGAEKLDYSVSLVEVCDALKEVMDLAVYAPEQAGKTTFAKYLIEDSRHQGITALYFDGAKLKTTNRGDVTGWINSSIAFQYEKDCHALIDQLEPRKVMIVLDNVHQLPGSSQAVKEIIERLKMKGGKMVYLTAQNPAITLLAANKSSADEVKLWSDAKWYELLPLNNKRRGELIRRWSSLGRDEAVDRDEIEVDVRQTKLQLDRVLGKNFMPKYPFFLLMLLQQFENSRDTNTVINNGSQGHIFQALITNALEANVGSHDIGVTQDFLSRFAFELWTSSVDDISSSGFARLVSDFRREALVGVRHPELLVELVSAGLVSNENDAISFRYNYLYYYFLGRWLANHRSSTEASRAVDYLIDNIHTEMSVNVVMFVSHLGHEEWILEKLLELAGRLFPGEAECKLASHASLAAKYSSEPNAIVLVSGPSADVSDHQHEQEDKVGLDEEPQRLEDVFQFSTAIRTIQALGQILRSRAGNIDGDVKIRIARCTTALARRLMSSLYDVAEESAASLVENVSELFETEVKVDSKEAAHLANRLISAVIGGIAKSIVARASEVFASRDLLPLIERLEDLHSADESLDNQLICLVARVGAEPSYPRERVNAMLSRIRDADVLTHAALAHSVMRSFYLNPPPRAVRDSACAKLGITVKKLPPKRKESLNVSRFPAPIKVK